MVSQDLMIEERVSGTTEGYKIFAIGDIHGCLWGLRSEERFSRNAETDSPRPLFHPKDPYRPCGDAWKYPPLDRKITKEEWERALKLAYKYGLTRLDDRRARFWDY